MKITAAIITLNEERNIARAIESLRCADEILIVDSGSVHRTVELAQNLGARVLEAGWRGYAGQKNLATDQAANDWILSLDADETISETLESEIWNLKKSGPEFDGYTMPRLARYLGRWIYHPGWYPDRKIRLYDRRKAKWVGDFVHERDRKSTRLNSSHLGISYAVFCLKKNNTIRARAMLGAARILLSYAMSGGPDDDNPSLFFFLMIRRPPRPTLFPFPALFR